MALAPVLVGLTAFWLVSAHYLAAFVAAVLIPMCMEMRVRAGWRMMRSWHFPLHVAAGVSLIVSLALLAFTHAPAWMPLVAAVCLVAVSLGGGALLVRQYLYLPN